MLSIQVHSYNKHYIHLRWILCLILSLFTTLPAISQSRVRHQTSLSDTLLKLKEVTIYSNRMQKKMSPVQILSGKELEKLNVYSVADALRYFSGVQIKDYGGIGGLKTVNIRSMGSHHVGVFYDGIEVSVSAILSCRPFFILIFLRCIKMKHYGFSRKSIWKNLETFP